MAAPSDTDFLSPKDAVHQVAFDNSPPKKKTDASNYEPLAPPPASPPPLPPPPSDALQQPLPASNHSGKEYGSSYQHSTTNNSRRAEMPRVTHYSTFTTEGSGWRGDATLRPNTGEQNSADGEALNERLHKLQFVLLINSVAAILLEIPAFVGHVFTLHTSRAVLGMYVILFSLILALFELHTPIISDVLKDNLGILQHPLGKALYLLLLGGLCIGQAWWAFYVVGGIFCLSALQLVYCWIKFPLYRHMYEETEDVDLWSAATSRYSWAQPENVGLLSSAMDAATSATTN